MKVLFCDVETTGKIDFSKPADDPCQPRMIQIAWTVIDDETRKEVEGAGGNRLIMPDGWTMPDELAQQLGHGYTTEVLAERGVPVAEAMVDFLRDHDQADLLVGYSFSYDQKILRGECRRLSFDDRYGAKPHLDVMYACAPAVKAHPGYGGSKKIPKLVEAHELLIGSKLEGAHDAFNDMQGTGRIYFWLKDNGHPLEHKQHTPKAKDAA